MEFDEKFKHNTHFEYSFVTVNKTFATFRKQYAGQGSMKHFIAVNQLHS